LKTLFKIILAVTEEKTAMAKTRETEQPATKPAYSVFIVEEREGKDSFWLKIGAAFHHKDGKGLNLVLQALPLDGRLVLREYKEPEPKS
jgi:hypothetical protein